MACHILIRKFQEYQTMKGRDFWSNDSILEKSQKRFLARKGDFILVLIGSPKWYISYILLIFLAQIFRISRKKLSHLSRFSIFPAWATPNFRPRIVKSDGGLAFFVRLYYDVKYRVEKWLFSAFKRIFDHKQGILTHMKL